MFLRVLSARSCRCVRMAFVVVGLMALQACSSELYTGLDQREANEIVAALLRSGIPAERVAGTDGTMTVTVTEKRFAQAMAVLDQAGLPREKFQTLGEVFKRDGLVSSPTEERAAMLFGLSQELSQTVSEIDGVLSARVHVVLPENDPLRQNLTPSSASVFIRHRDDTLMSELVPQVKMLVSNGISGLTYDKVSVTLVPVPPAANVSTDDPQFVNVFGLWVHPDSASMLTWLIVGLGALVVVLGIVLARFGFQRRSRVYSLTGPDDSLPAKIVPARRSEVTG